MNIGSDTITQPINHLREDCMNSKEFIEQLDRLICWRIEQAAEPIEKYQFEKAAADMKEGLVEYIERIKWCEDGK